MPDSGPLPVREGDMLAGKYRVERVLGIGGMGIVVAARHEQLDQRVAIKFVRDEALGNEEAVERFLREARAAVKLKSEHAAKVLDVGTLDSGAPYMVMEFLEGSDLSAVLSDRGPLSVELAAEYVLQACEAVAEAHAAGIVHRDLKPQNLFLARTVGGATRVKVLDFGVSKSLTASGGPGALTQTKSMLGSPLYMSPEQMRSSRDVDARSDVWALGVVLFELLTRRWPYEAETMPELCLKVVTDPPQSLAALRPDVPPALVQIVERCLQKDPLQRFANAAELASAIEPFAPPASRVIAERARLAVGGMAHTQLASAGQGAAGESAARTAATPAAWGSGNRTAPQPGADRKGGAAIWIVGAVAVAACALAGALLLRSGHDSTTQAPSPPAPATQVAPAPPPPPVVSVAPPANTAATTVPAPTETAAASSVPASPSASASANRAPWLVGRPPPAAPPGHAPGARPKSTDDDIPSLR